MSNRKLDDGASVAEHARRLRSRPGWDPSRVVGNGTAVLRDELRMLSLTEERLAPPDCPACREQQRASGDSTALCRDHLARVMGLGTPGTDR